MTDRSPSTRGASPRYLAKQEAILHTAAVVFNRLGVGGATLNDVASDVDLNLTSIRHYYTRKDALVAACYARTFAFHDSLIDEAQQGATASERLSILVRAYFRERRRISEGEAPEYLHFGDLRALTPPFSLEIHPRFARMFRGVRALLTDGDWQAQSRAILNARAHAVISHFLWSVVWLQGYLPQDYPRVAERFLDILLGGLMTRPADWWPAPVVIGDDDQDAQRRSVASFLRAATAAINSDGYHNASIDRISARLNVTKGSFYYHMDGQGDLVVACFNRTFDIMRAAQQLAAAPGRSGALQAADAAAGLVRRQLTAEGTLLRTSALTAIDLPVRREITREMDAITRRFSDMLADGVIDGSVRPCDTNIAAQMITGLVNSAEELDRFVPQSTETTVVDDFVRPLFCGLFAAPAG